MCILTCFLGTFYVIWAFGSTALRPLETAENHYFNLTQYKLLNKILMCNSLNNNHTLKQEFHWTFIKSYSKDHLHISSK